MDGGHDLLKFLGQPSSIIEYLDSLPFDELVEIDLFNNRIRNLFHVEGKYFVPVFDGPFKDLYRYSSENMIHPDDKSVHKKFMNHDTILERLAASDTPGVISEEFRYRLQNGSWRWVKQVIVGGPQFGFADGIIRFYVFDIQNRKQRELGNDAMGQHHVSGRRDSLTGLRWENEFFAEAREQIAAGKCNGWCFIALDIDQFKLFNDWNGREAGDFVLAAIGGYLVDREINDGWIAGYLGQDNFCILMPHSETEIKNLYRTVSDTIALIGKTMSFTPLLGICMVDETDAVLDLLDRAELATNAARRNFKRRIRYYASEMHEQTDAEYRLLTDFQKAISNGEIFYVLQPQCRVSTGQIVGAEALARWRRESGEIVQPNEFVPVLEKYGFVTDLDRYIWEGVCARIRSWIDAGRTPIPISVNVSRYDVYNLDIAYHFESLVKKYELPTTAIKVEITESAYVDDTGKVNEMAQRLRDKGFVVLIDDFGSGYSSLNMLDSMNVDVIKLDMEFLRMSHGDKRKSIRILESTVNMAKALGLAVITEGAETSEHADFLRSIGCRYAQGYHFYRPMTCEDFEQLVSDEAIIDRGGFQVKSNDEFRIREFLDQNVYSDSMLNSILGPLGVFSWHGENVDIIRFNEQFYEELGVESIGQHLAHNQEYVDARDYARYFELLYDAMEDEMNGATDVIRYRRLDGTPLDILLHFYYLGEVDESKRFYGTIRNITQLTELRDELSLMSSVAHAIIAFLRYHEDGWGFNIGVHGLEKELGLSREEFESELEDRTFFDRLDGETGDYLRKLSYYPDEKLGDFTMPLDITIPDGTIAKTKLSSFCVQDERSVFSYVLVLQMRTD